MKPSLERRWVAVQNTSSWRRISKSDLGRRFFDSRLFRSVDTRRRYLLSSRCADRDPRIFECVESCCLFIGHVKSGGTLLGALIDAHPEAVLADEIDVVDYARKGFSRDQIFHLLVKGARREALKGRVTARRLEAYSWAVPGQWQGRHEQLRVVGSSKAGETTRGLGTDSQAWPKLQSAMNGTRTAFVHVIRNPFEPISAMIRRGGRTHENAIADYRAQCRRLVDIRRLLPHSDLLTVRYEDVVQTPGGTLRQVCAFLGLEASEAYVEACTSILHDAPVADRHRVEWNPSHVAQVDSVIAEFDFLAGYGFDR